MKEKDSDWLYNTPYASPRTLIRILPDSLGAMTNCTTHWVEASPGFRISH